jgi:hypothetical protein
MSAARRAQVLGLFRAFLREARLLPTEVRRDYVRNKARHEFKASVAAADPQQAEFLLQFGELQLENLTLQRKLLNQLRDEGKLKC